MSTVTDEVRRIAEDIDDFLCREHETPRGAFIHRVLQAYVDAPDSGLAQVEALDMSRGQRLEIHHALWAAHHLAAALALEAEDRDIEAYQQLLEAMRADCSLRLYSMALKRGRESADRMKRVQGSRHKVTLAVRDYAVERAKEVGAPSARQAAKLIEAEVVAYAAQKHWRMSEDGAFNTIYNWLLTAAKPL